MIDVAVSDAGLEAVDGAKNEVRVRADGWDHAPGGPDLRRRVDAAVSGTTRGLVFPDATVAIEREGVDGWTLFDDRTGPVELAVGPLLIQVATTMRVYVAVAGGCRLVRDPSDGTVGVRFDRPARVTVGFRSPVEAPRARLTVPGTFDGAVVAVRHLSSAIDGDTPDKSYPTMRGHPPRVEFGPTVDVPSNVRRDAGRSSIVVGVPPALEALFVVAPLVYYLHADVRATAGGAVTVEAPTLSTPLVLARGADLERDVARLLHRVFFLDCLVRNAGPYGLPVREAALLEPLDIDPEAVYRQSGAGRLATYLECDYARVVDRLPDWSRSLVAAPTLANLPVLPFVLDRLSLVQRPEPVAVPKGTLIAESVARSFGTRSGRPGGVPTADPVRNATRLATRQAWLAEGTPVDASRATRAAYESRFRYHRQRHGPRQVLVVINDDAMLDERAGVERIYRSRAEELAIDVAVTESVTRADLARWLRSPVDFLHYIGHCDATGLRCADGSLAVGELDRTSVQTFFLNACGSFDQGLELVRRGSVAGAVTIHEVLNPEATRVGLSFARLVMHGFSVDHALDLASRQTVANRFYTVVGDGAHRLAQGEDTLPAALTADRVSPDEVAVRFDFPPGTVPGGLARPALPDVDEYVLRGRPYRTVLRTDAFAAFLASVTVPVVYEGVLHWSTELAGAIDPERSSGLSV